MTDPCTQAIDLYLSGDHRAVMPSDPRTILAATLLRANRASVSSEGMYEHEALEYADAILSNTRLFVACKGDG